MPEEFKKNCFVIMAFDPEIESIWEKVFVPVIESAGCKPLKVDVNEDGSSLSDLIFQYIRNSPLIVADLTLARPNCYLEVGYALGLNKHKNLILCCREDHNPDSPNYKPGSYKIHFDLRQHFIIWWEISNLEKFKMDLMEKINQRRDLIEKKEEVPLEKELSQSIERVSESEVVDGLEVRLKNARQDFERWIKKN